jgi:hypothetical protein
VQPSHGELATQYPRETAQQFSDAKAKDYGDDDQEKFEQTHLFSNDAVSRKTAS